jgi:hypothetical protein
VLIGTGVFVSLVLPLAIFRRTRVTLSPTRTSAFLAL